MTTWTVNILRRPRGRGPASHTEKDLSNLVAWSDLCLGSGFKECFCQETKRFDNVSRETTIVHIGIVIKF